MINLLAVPALALAGTWPLAAALMVLERTGRAIRRPNVETMLSYSAKEMGSGWVFGLNEALDQAGATLGPLVVALVLYLRGGYHSSFAILLAPAILCLATLAFARVLYPRPQDLERREAQSLEVKGFTKPYWLYVLAGALIAAGFADFALIAFHFQKSAVVSTDFVPILYAVAMATGAISALVFGRLLEKIGFTTLLIAFFISAFFAPLVFYGGFTTAVIGMILWGLGLGAQDSLLKAIISKVAPPQKRGTAFGLFDTFFGVAWFLGSALMGFLYDHSILLLVAFSVVIELAALPVFLFARRV